MITITTIHAHEEETHETEHHEEAAHTTETDNHDHDNDGHADHAAEDHHTETAHPHEEMPGMANFDTIPTPLLVVFGLAVLLIGSLVIQELRRKEESHGE